MTDETPANELAMPAAFDAYPPAEPAQSAPVSPVALVLGLLRGRYHWAIGIGGTLAVAGALAGWNLVDPVYRSAGMIEVAPKVPKILYDSDEKAMLPMFDAFVSSQASFCATRRVVDLALSSDAWKKLGRGNSDDDVAAFRDNLAVNHPKSTQHFEIAYLDTDPEAATVGVNEVINAYMRLVEERENDSGLDTLKALEKTKSEINGRLNDMRADVNAVTGDLGEPALEARYAFEIDQLNRLNTLVHDINLEIARAKADFGSGAKERELTEDEIALRDPEMQRLVDERTAASDKVSYLVEVDKLGPNNPELVNARRAVESVDRRIALRIKSERTRLAGMAAGSETNPRVGELARVVALRDQTLEETRRLGKKRLQLQNLAAERATLVERLADVNKRLEQINVESVVRGRISVSSYGDRPAGPDTDRRKPLAAFSASGGLLLGFGIVLLWGLREGRLRHVADVDGKSSRGRFLGVLPEVASEAEGADAAPQGEMADYCVHHIRTMLQLRSADHKGVVALTSPSPGAGKTTLSLALGMSYANSGSRTLLVDCDFVGHGLTSAIRSLVCDGTVRALTASVADAAPEAPARGQRRRIMSSLLAARQISFDDRQVSELLAATRARGAGGDAEAERAVRALEQLARPGESADDRRRGIVGALDGRALENCVVETGVPNLSLLPVGDATEEDAKCLSRAGLERLVESCRGRYDTVLIDTGPVLGSIEASFAVAASDDVLVVVSRGERRPAVDDALERISTIGADVAGVVFNRATSADVAMSSYASRSRSRPVEVA